VTHSLGGIVLRGLLGITKFQASGVPSCLRHPIQAAKSQTISVGSEWPARFSDPWQVSWEHDPGIFRVGCRVHRFPSV
jgi:hypothetical protein